MARRSTTVDPDATTRIAILRAAERLFATRGIDSVSLREIAAAADQRNNSAAAYHFGDKRSLLDSLLRRHSDPIQEAWLVALTHMADEGRASSLEELVGLLVRPLVRKLDDPDGGADYLIVVSQLISSRTFPITELPIQREDFVRDLIGSIVGMLRGAPPPARDRPEGSATTPDGSSGA